MTVLTTQNCYYIKFTQNCLTKVIVNLLVNKFNVYISIFFKAEIPGCSFYKTLSFIAYLTSLYHDSFSSFFDNYLLFYFVYSLSIGQNTVFMVFQLSFFKFHNHKILHTTSLFNPMYLYVSRYLLCSKD